MPGYDGMGPMGVGPRTGGGRGRCRRPAHEAASMEDPYQYYGIGWGYSPWTEGGGGRRFRGRGSGRGRGFARGAGEFFGPDDAGSQRETFLMRRMDELTAAQIRADTLEQENRALASQTKRYWFMAGALVLLVGVLLGIWLPRIRWQRRSRYDRF